MTRCVFAAVFVFARASWAGTAAAQTAVPAQGAAQAAQVRAADPANAGRLQLDQYLDAIAAQYTKLRAAGVASLHTRAQAEARQANVRGLILQLIGTLPKRTPLHAQALGESHADGFRIRKMIFESQPGFRVTALLYLPDGQAAEHSRPAILMSPGHAPSGKAGDAGTAALFALNGFVVLSYDSIGQGERLQYPDPARPGNSLAKAPTGEHSEASLQPMLIGDTFARYELWDAMRGIDYLSEMPDVDPHRIGAFGCSGGGTITAMASALDPRIAAVGVACYTTSFDTLLPTLGPQDAEQSTPRFISADLDFPDWIELAAPRPYAVIATYSDMFPFAGARSSVIEARRFYSLFDPASAGTPFGGGPPAVPPTPAAPALNADTTNRISSVARLQFITGPGGHGALRPIMGHILSFFMRNLEPGADADHPKVPAAYLAFGATNAMASLPKDAFQVTPTGQVSSSFPNCATVFSLNRVRAAEMISANPPSISDKQLAATVREATGAVAIPRALKYEAALLASESGAIALPSDGGYLEGKIAIPGVAERHPAVLFLVPGSIDADNEIAREQGEVRCAGCRRPCCSGHYT
jgi:dienelactone hydrolase